MNQCPRKGVGALFWSLLASLFLHGLAYYVAEHVVSREVGRVPDFPEPVGRMTLSLRTAPADNEIETSPVVTQAVTPAPDRKSRNTDAEGSETEHRLPPRGAGGVSKPPELLSEAPTSVGRLSARPGTGHIELALLIGKNGRVEKITTVESTMETVVEYQVIRQFNQTTWSPAQINGVAVEAEVRLRIDLANP